MPLAEPGWIEGGRPASFAGQSRVAGPLALVLDLEISQTCCVNFDWAPVAPECPSLSFLHLGLAESQLCLPLN